MIPTLFPPKLKHRHDALWRRIFLAAIGPQLRRTVEVALEIADIVVHDDKFRHYSYGDKQKFYEDILVACVERGISPTVVVETANEALLGYEVRIEE